MKASQKRNKYISIKAEPIKEKEKVEERKIKQKEIKEESSRENFGVSHPRRPSP